MSKIKCRKLILIAAIAGFSSSAVTADDGTITFTGSISDATCEITGGDETNQNQGADFTVNMPMVSTTALAKKDQYAGDSPFFIHLSGTQCPNGKVANVIFERAQSSNINSTTGYLNNTTTKAAGGATNVAIRILNKDKNPLNLTLVNTEHQPVTITENKASFQYWGQYAALGVATSGLVTSNVVYSITYR